MGARGRGRSTRQTGTGASHLEVIITDQPRAAAEAAIAQLGVGLTVDEMLESPYYLIGTVAYMVDRLQELRHLYGVSYILFFPEYTDAFAPVIARLAGV